MNAQHLNRATPPTHGAIKGNIQMVRNKYGSDDILALRGLKVTLQDRNGKWLGDEYTDDEGGFAFLGEPLNSYTVVFPETIEYYQQQYFAQGVALKVSVTLSEESPESDVDMRYVLPQAGLMEGGDGQSMLSRLN